MHKKLITLTMATALGVASSTVAAAGCGQLMDSNMDCQQQGNITYISGGVGSDERDALKAASHQFNLKLVFVRNDGAFLSKIPVRIEDAGGRQVLATTTTGPWLFARLPAGSYKAYVDGPGADYTRHFTVGSRHQTRLDFRWKLPGDLYRPTAQELTGTSR